MSEFSNIKKGLSKIESLERELHLKQLQINRLLTITQAINDNIAESGLYEMYHSFLSWEMEVKKMALYVSIDGKWTCPTHIGIAPELIKMDIADKLQHYQRMKNLEEDKDHPLIEEFDIVIPVLHKSTPIAYTFIGGFGNDDDMYQQIQFITTITNVIAVAIENKRLFKRQIVQERFKKEMELAIEIQQMLIPSVLPQGDDYEFSSIYKPHLGVGGDYFDFVDLDEDTFAFCIADISGKGVSAALLMANFQANFKVLIKKRENFHSLIQELNQAVIRITNGDKFLTFFVGEYDKITKELTYVNAGHNPPVMINDDKVTLLQQGCTILGSFPKIPTIEVGKEIIEPGTMIVTYTDGITDVQNKADDYFDEKLLIKFAIEHHHLTANLFNEKLMDTIDEFKKDEVYPDDITVLTCKIFE